MTEPGVVWSFFSGAMGLDLGLERAGVVPSLAVELDPVFCATIARNRPGLRVLQTDVAKLDATQLRRLTGHDGEVDLMVGGPPCQSFCPGGKRAALDDPRGNLILEYLRLIGEVRPRRFVLENVANLVTAADRHRPIDQRPGKSWNLASYSRGRQAALFDADGARPLEPDEQSGSAIRLILESALAELSYGVAFGVFDAAGFGAPQRRHRFVLLGDRSGSARAMPAPTHLAAATVRDAIADLQADPGPGSQYTDEVRAVFDLVPEGGNWRDLPDDVAVAAMGPRSYSAGGGKTGFFRRLAWDEPSPTITGRANRKGSALCHPAESRPLSVYECARLQGFPDAWEFSGSMNRQYMQVGNAVPTALGTAIGHAVRSSAITVSADHEAMLAESVRVLHATARNRRKAVFAA